MKFRTCYINGTPTLTKKMDQHLPRIPFFIDALKKPVRIVELAALELDHPLGVLSDQEADHITWAAVMRPI
jgi:hypothetical protein